MSAREQAYGAAVFRKHWRQRQSAAARPGELISQPRWIDTGLAALAAVLVGGATVAGSVTVAGTDALPAVAQGASVTATRAGDSAPEPGTTVQFRSAGTSRSAVVVEVTGTEVLARLDQLGPPAVGELVVPGDRERLIGLLLPRLS